MSRKIFCDLCGEEDDVWDVCDHCGSSICDVCIVGAGEDKNVCIACWYKYYKKKEKE